ncbi:MAG: hypothetical protein M5U08_15630 [Burkholderiales bacterium]|nr:hypothetical protein [Burkholderiales bacterium]
MLLALRQRLGRRAPLRDERRDDRADARAADPVDRDLRLGERAQHAEMREAACAAAAEHEPDPRPVQTAREAREIVRAVGRHVVVAVDLAPREDGGRGGGPGRRVQQDETAAGGATAAPPFGERALGLARLRGRGVDDEHNVVGLAHRPLGPAGQLRLGLVDDEAMPELLLVQPLHEAAARGIVVRTVRKPAVSQRIVDVPCVEVQRAAEPGERGAQPAREFRGRGIRAGGHHGKGPDFRGRTPGNDPAMAQARAQERADLPQHCGLALDQSMEGGRRDPREQRVAHREHGRRAPLRREERHLAQDLPGGDVVQRQPAHAVVDHPQPPAEDGVGRVPRVAASEQHLAAAQRHPLRVGLQFGERFAVGGAEERREVRGELSAPEPARLVLGPARRNGLDLGHGCPCARAGRCIDPPGIIRPPPSVNGSHRAAVPVHGFPPLRARRCIPSALRWNGSRKEDS